MSLINRIWHSIFLTFFITFVRYGQVQQLIWEDNFNNNELDLTKWNIEVGTGINGDWGTGQIDRATDRPENISFQSSLEGADDGCLVITTRNEYYIDRQYTSGRINTAGKASWGPGHRIVVKAFPRDVKYKGQGFAFWMMPDEIPAGWDYIMWPQGGEIDIMEYVGSIPYNNLGSVHYAWFWENNQWQSWNHGHQGAYYNYQTQEVPIPSEPGYGNYPPPPNDSNAGSYGFHEYGIDWYTDRIEFFVDNNVYHIHYLEDGGAFGKDGQDAFAISNIENRRVGVSEYSNHFNEWHPFEHRMYAILSAGVGGSNYTYGGEIVPEAIFPCSVFIDWIKVYTIENSADADETMESIDIGIYPNPAVDKLTIQINNPDNYNIRILNNEGKQVYSLVTNKSTEINLTQFRKGTYLFIATYSGYTVSKKLLIH